MTKDEALTMIIASIAMEELALSHIVNAEGEKLQYVLGTLPGGGRPCASTQEILAVNKSVTDLLDTVMQSQMLLKGKLEKALEAGGHAPAPQPPRPCEPPCPCEPPSGPDKPPCGCAGPWEGRSAIHLAGRRGFTWENGVSLPWRCQSQRGGGIRWDEKRPTLVSLDPQKMYVLYYIIDVCVPYPGDSSGSVAVKLAPGSAFSEVPPQYFSVKCAENKPLTLHCAAMLFPQARPAPCADLSLLLHCRGSLVVEKASLSIVEI